MNPQVSTGDSRQKLAPEALSVRLQLVGVPRRNNAGARFWRFAVIAEVIADLLTITFSVMLGYFLYNWMSLGRQVYYEVSTVFAAAAAFALLMILMLYRSGAYRRGKSLLRVRETEQVLRVSAEAFVVAITASFLFSFLFSRWLLTLCLVLVPLALFLQKNALDVVISILQSHGYGMERLLIYGAGSTGRRVLSVLTRSPKLGLDPILFVDDDPAKSGTRVTAKSNGHRTHIPVVRGPVDRDVLFQYGVDSLIIAVPSISRDMLLYINEEAARSNVRVFFVPSQLLLADPLVEYRDIGGMLLASFDKPERWVGHEVVKRGLDVLGALLLLTVGAPLLLLLAILVKLDSPGSAWFRQERVGENGTLFRMFKLRTMYNDASPYEFSPTQSADSRITRIGRFLRKTSLDELPQLFNVLGGSMSLVGPRPEMPFIVDQYSDWQRQRLRVKPGLTGLWQLSGDRAFLIHENIDYDLYYIQNRNLFMDLAILLHTPVFAMRGI